MEKKLIGGDCLNWCFAVTNEGTDEVLLNCDISP